MVEEGRPAPPTGLSLPTRDEAIFSTEEEEEQISIPIDKVEREIQFLTKNRRSGRFFF